ncbi:MAG: M14 family metallopeptidase [Pseudomonadales bacterium]|nr:M14 family metallopeptidase [Pseudomonadales bacterium]
MSSQYFSVDYFEAREKFLTAARAAEGKTESFLNPRAKGPGGEDLYTDVAVFGDPASPKVLVIVSGTHGNEGFCGSGCQVGFVEEGLIRNKADDTFVVMIHALNCYGFANVRRVTEDNADLNRNFVDHEQPYASNEAYAEIHHLLVPEDWTPETVKAANKGLAIYRSEHGDRALQNAVSGGQHSHPDGVFFGGTRPSWSNVLLRQLIERYCKDKLHVALIDFHTGLGPNGYGELILNGDFEQSWERAQRWYNNEVTSFQDGSSTSAELTGMMCFAFLDVMPADRLTGIAVEYGTVSSAEVLYAMRFDNWISLHEKPGTPRWLEGKKTMRDALYCDNDEWKARVWERAQWVLSRAYDGLATVTSAE